MTPADWVTWGLQVLLLFLLSSIWKKLDENTKAIGALALELAKDYVTKIEWETIRKRLHEIESKLAGIEMMMNAK